MFASEVPAALTSPIAVALDALTLPPGAVFSLAPPAPPVVFGALTLLAVLGALPVVGALTLVLPVLT